MHKGEILVVLGSLDKMNNDTTGIICLELDQFQRSWAKIMLNSVVLDEYLK